MHQDIRIFPFHTPGNFFHRKALSCLVIYRHDRHQQSILIHCMNHIIRASICSDWGIVPSSGCVMAMMFRPVLPDVSGERLLRMSAS